MSMNSSEPKNVPQVKSLPGGVTTVTVPMPPDINFDLLKEQVQADPKIAGAGFWSFNPGVDPEGKPVLILGLTGDASRSDPLADLNAVIAAHDPTRLTPEQVRARQEEAARARLEAQAQAGRIDDPSQAILDILTTLGYGKGTTP
jgi:hypothetical protein